MSQGLFPQTLAAHLKGVCRQAFTDKKATRELRIFLTSFPPDVIHDVICQVEDFIASNKKQIQQIYKVGSALWKEWNKSPNGDEKGALQQIDEKGWVDHEDRLTHYRNMKCPQDFDFLVVFLVGVEKATDRAGLKDFYVVDASTVWSSELKCSFVPWLKDLLMAHQISVKDQQHYLKEMDDLLKALHRYGTGDLVQIARFLESLNLNIAQDTRDVLVILHEGLPFWGLPPLKDIPLKKTTAYLKDAISFFSYRDYLKASERKKALKKLDLFEADYHAEKINPDIPEEFNDIDDLLVCIRGYVEKNDPELRKRLLKVDFVFISEILKRKPIIDGPVDPPPPRLRKLDGSPLEAILTAVWLTLIDFKKKCDSKHLQPGKILNEIRLRAIEFRHDLDDKHDARCLIKGCLGGIDAFLEKNLRLECDVEGEPKTIKVSSRLSPTDESHDLILKSSRSSIPGFQFAVVFKADNGLDVTAHFQWQLPEVQPYRNLWNFARSVRDEIQKHPGYVLPVFTIPYYDELFLAPDTEEVNRILKLGVKGLRLHNLLDAPGLDSHDPTGTPARDLAFTFGEFLQAFVDTGWFTALETLWGKLFRRTKAAFNKLLSYEQMDQSTQFAPLLYKMFMLLREPAQGMLTQWIWASYVDSTVLTGLHPCLLEMMHHRDTFLIHGFTSRFGEAMNSVNGMKIPPGMWQDVCDIATIHYPLFGIICNPNKDLNTDVTSFGLIHRFGTGNPQGATLSSKVLLRHTSPEDEEMSDSDLFRQSRESQVITRVLMEYTELNPHVQDGLSLAVLNVRNLQTIISGVDAFLYKRRLKIQVHEPPVPYHFSLTIFVAVNDSQSVSRWLQEWRRRWSAARNNGQSTYEGCRLSVSQRIITDSNDYLYLLGKDDFDADIALLPHFIDAGSAGNDISPATPYQDQWACHIKFPIVEVPRCADKHPALAFERKRIISNRQFELPTLHSELNARFKHPGNPTSQKHLVISRGDFSPWLDIVDQLHKKSTWVVCLDPCIDERLIGLTNVESTWKREIIGFASGLGVHGELNYTISTERSSLADVEKGIREQINSIFGPWTKEDIAKTAHRLVTESRKLSGLSLVRATGPSQYIHDLIGYALTRICLPELPANETLLCDELLTLDSFRHWFETAESGERPDLLRLVVYLKEDGRIEVAAQLIECKVAKQTDAYLQKAHGQVENGLRHLTSIFCPRYAGKPDRFDQRFWWAQLQRLIAGKGIVDAPKQQAVTGALEALGEGRFDIRWQAMVVAFWTDSQEEQFSIEKKWGFETDAGKLDIEVISAGKGLIRKVCCTNEMVELPIPQSQISLISDTHKGNGAEVHKEHDKPTEATIIDERIGEEAGQEQVLEGEVSSWAAHTDVGTSGMLQTSLDASPTTEPCQQLVAMDKPVPHDITTDMLSDQPHVTIQKEMTLATPTIPPRILLGRTDAGREIYWEYGHSELTNRHLLIFGKSGSGKTYAIQAILCELGLQRQNSVIIDYTDGFETTHLEQETLEILKPEQHFVVQYPLPINPFRRQLSFIGDQQLPEKVFNTAQRVMSVFSSVYNLGDQQKSLLYECVKDGIESHEAGMDLERLVEGLDQYVSEGQKKDTAISLLAKIKPFVDGQPFGQEDPKSWLKFYQDQEHRTHIIQLKSCGKEFGRLVTEFALIDLFWFARATGDVHHPKVVVLDEIQNLDHSQEGPVAGFLTEGRKFGLSMILATQTLMNLKIDARNRLFQASHKLFFRPAEPEVNEYAKILESTIGDSAEIWRKKLSSLGKGECYSLGPSMNPKTAKLEDRAFPIRITSLGERLEKHGKG